MAATLSLKYGDLVLDDRLEAWSEALDWGTDARVVPGAWAGVANARRMQGRRITVSGFIGQNVADPLTQHQADLSSTIANINASVEDSRRTGKALWQLWFHDDRYILCRPTSFTVEHIDGVPWASRFTATFVCPDPRWYAASGSSRSFVMGGSSAFASMQVSNPGDAPTEPRFYYQFTGTSQLALTNRYKNLLANAMFRDGSGTVAGVPTGWARTGGAGYTQHVFDQWGDSYGKVWIENPLGTAGGRYIQQTVKMTEPETGWTLSGSVFLESLSGTSAYYRLQLEFLDQSESILATSNSASLTTVGTKQSVVVANAVAPQGTQYIRSSFAGEFTAGGTGRAYAEWLQLERGTTNTTLDAQEQETLTLTYAPSGSVHAWLDLRYGKGYYVTTSASGNPTDLVPYLTAGRFWSYAAGSNELLVEAGGSPSGQALTAYWDATWWGK